MSFEKLRREFSIFN